MVTTPKKGHTMAPKKNDTPQMEVSQEEFASMMYERMRMAIRSTLETILEEEIEAVTCAGRYERSPERQDYRNGRYNRDLGTTVGQIEELSVPRTRKGYQTKVFERYQRRRGEVDEAIRRMYVQGLSDEQVGNVVEALTEMHPSPSTVSRVYHSLEGEFEGWKKRLLETHYLYAFADGTYFTVIYNEEGCKMPILAVVGVKTDGQKELLGFRTGDRENEQAWKDLLDDLKARGMEEVDLWITDGGQAMINAIESRFPQSRRQRCAKHKMENVLGYIPEKQHAEVEPELKGIFYQDSREKAEQALAAFCEKFARAYPSAIECLKRDQDALLSFYDFPKEHWKTIRTSNVIERLFCDVKKRTHKMAAAFRNENSCLLMFFAITRSLKFRRISMPKEENRAPKILHNS